VITWLLAFVLAIFLPRYLGATAIGQLSIANSIWLIMGVLMAFGMDLYLTTSVARTPERMQELLSTSLMLRVIFFFVSCALVGCYLTLLHYDFSTIVITFIIGFSALTFALVSGITAVFTGLEHMQYASIANIAGKSVYTLLTFVLFILGQDIYTIAAAQIASGVVPLVILLFFFRRFSAFRWHFDFGEARRMLTQSSQYLVTGLMLVIYQQIDKLFISSMVDTRMVGWYGTAMNLFGTLMFIPVVFGSVIYPVLSRSYTSSTGQLQLLARRGMDLMFTLSIPIGLGIVLIARPLIALLYGAEFSPSGSILEMLGVVLIFTYLNTMVGQLLIATDRTAKWNMVMVAAILMTVPLDLLLVPWAQRMYGNGGLGGTTSFLLTESTMLVVGILLLPAGTLSWSNVRTALLALISGLLMVAAAWWWRDSYLALSIAVAAITYMTLVIVLRVVPRQDLELAVRAAQQVLARVRRSKQAPASAGN
jgi:O-antigen/teichoic acid export membrane protein